ncbi:MAG: hypothetical protein ABI878_08065 [Acidobacteriota bacterium]
MTGPFKTLEDAVRAGFKSIINQGNKQAYEEYGFWVAMKPNEGGKGVHFCYTDVVGSGANGYVDLIRPTGLIVVGHCHTHPHSTHSGSFSTRDKNNFLQMNDSSHKMPCYLLNPQSEIRLGKDAKDFPAGVPVSW